MIIAISHSRMGPAVIAASTTCSPSVIVRFGATIATP